MKKYAIYVRVDQVKDTIYIDQTGKFPITPSSGHKYIMIMCEIDANAVFVELMTKKQRTK